MDYSKYYTPIDIAERLMDEVGSFSPISAVDICCGSFNLLLAAKKKWPNLSIVGVDINPSINQKIDNFQQNDGRDFALNNRGKFELVVANPPFGNIGINNSFPQLYDGFFVEYRTSRIEIEMLIANLFMLAKNGILLIILPSSFVEGERYNNIREIIANNYSVDKIIKLDIRTFGSAMINSYALVIRNTKPVKCAKLLDFSSMCNNKEKIVASVDLLSGNWLSTSNSCNIAEWDVRRGTISSSFFIQRGQPILHTSKVATKWYPQIRYISKKTKPHVLAENGDIIVSRIGKSAGEWCLYKGEKIPISDCLFRIKDPDGKIAKRICGKKYNKAIKGVTTKYITYTDFIEWVESV